MPKQRNELPSELAYLQPAVEALRGILPLTNSTKTLGTARWMQSSRRLRDCHVAPTESTRQEERRK
jgi:hypothetical protein